MAKHKNIILIFIAFIALSVSCKKETAAPETPVTTITKPPTVKSECYAYDANGSKIDLQIQYNGADVIGSLNYALSQKDHNTGTIVGKIENNILLAEYTFQSEGIESTRQVAFKLIDNTLVEGYGEMNEDGTRFKDVATLAFTSTMPLNKVDCTQ